MKRIFLLISLVMVVASCGFNGTYENEESEKMKAEKVINTFYGYIENQNFTVVTSMFAESFFKGSSESDVRVMLYNTSNILGVYKSKRVIDWKTKRIVGSNPSSEYFFVYEVIYDKYKATETLMLHKEGNQIKIYRYDINSEGFIK